MASSVPLFSLRFPTADATAAARDLLYVAELERQATLANGAIGNAIETSLRSDDETWRHVQSAMFAAIIVQRMLRPGRVLKPYAQHQTREESQAFADQRGQHLRGLPDIPDDSALFAVAAVRNAFEHFDEGLDMATRSDVICVSDWYLTEGMMIWTGEHDEGVSLGLRCYYPAAGFLYYEDKRLDLFALDEALFMLRRSILRQRPSLQSRIAGRGVFGGGRTTHLEERDVRQRLAQWVAMREQVGAAVQVTLVPPAGT